MSPALMILQYLHTHLHWESDGRDQDTISLSFSGLQSSFQSFPTQGVGPLPAHFSNLVPFSASSNKASLSQETPSSGVAQCPECSKQFEDRSYLRDHMMRFHSDKMPFTCTICGKGYLSNRGLQLHMQAHRGRRFQCPLCPQLLSQSSSIKPHIRSVHKAMQCPRCSAYFTIGQEFEEHSRTCGPY